MEQYISKAAIVAEITHKIKVLEAFIKNFDGISDKVEKAKNKIEALGDVLLSIENLQVKEVNLDAEIIKWEESFGHCPASMGYKETAKHFFGLGMSVSNKQN